MFEERKDNLRLVRSAPHLHSSNDKKINYFAFQLSFGSRQQVELSCRHIEPFLSFSSSDIQAADICRCVTRKTNLNSQNRNRKTETYCEK